MSEEKSYAEVYWKVRGISVGFNVLNEEIKGAIEKGIQAAIAEYKRRNEGGEAAGYFQLHQYGEGKPTHNQVCDEYKDSEGVFPLYAAPQLPSEPISAVCKIEGKCQFPIWPSEEAIEDCIIDVWSKSPLDAPDDLYWEAAAKAVYELLKKGK